MRRTLMAIAVVLSVASSAQAVTIRDIIDLAQAGLGDQVLLALIEVDGGVFDIDADTLAALHRAGVSEPVIVALVRSGRVAPPEQPGVQPSASQAQSAPQLVVVQSPPATIVRDVEVPVPVYVGVPIVVRHGQARTRAGAQGTIQGGTQLTSPLASRPYLSDRPPQPKAAEPVYWGWGGKLRPDAWRPR